MGLIKKLRKAKKEAPPNEKPAVVKTHLRNMIIVPEMIGSVVGIYNGKVFLDSLGRWVSRRDVFSQVFNAVEIKPEMTGHYLAEFSCSYRPVKHGRPGVCIFMMRLHLLLPSLPLDRCYTFISIHSSQVTAWFLLHVFYVLHLLLQKCMRHAHQSGSLSVVLPHLGWILIHSK
jgi:ribosomal protein S19